MIRARIRTIAGGLARRLALARRRGIPAYIGTIAGGGLTTAGIAQWSVPLALVIAGLAITGLSLIQLGLRETRR